MAEEIVRRVDEANDLLTRTHGERLEKVRPLVSMAL